MEENKFFKFIWRFNAIAIMIACLFVLLMISKETLEGFWQNDRPVITNIANDPEGQEKWKLGHVRKINSIIFLVTLVSENEDVKLGALKSGLHAYGDSDSARNLLFVDGKHNNTRWLFDSNNQIVNEFNFLPNDNEYKNESVKIITYDVITEDTNGDKKLSKDDLSSIALSKADGTNYKIVVKNTDRIIDISLIESDKLLIIFQKNNFGYSATFSTEDFSLIDQKELPKVP